MNELRTTTPSVSDLPGRTKGRVTIQDLPWWLAKTFDMAFAEQTLGAHLAPAHARVIDCYEENGVAYVDFEVTGSPVLPMIVAIAVALAVLGVAVAVIVVAVKTPEALELDWVKWAAIGLIAWGALRYLPKPKGDT